MSTTSTDSGARPAPSGLLARFIGIITSPRSTYQAVVADPRWFAMLALICISMAILFGGFMFTKVGQDAWVDAATTGAFARNMSEQQYAGIERMSHYAGYFAVLQMLVFIPVFYLIVAGILFAVFNAAMGGDSTFRQLFAVIVHSGAVGVLAQLFIVPMNYVRGSLTSATNLGVLLPMVDEASFLGRLIGTIDLFLIWQVIVLAIGLSVLHRRRTQPIAITLLLVYLVIGVCIAVVRTRLGGA